MNKCLAVVHKSQMVRCFPCALDFGQSNNTFYGISTFFKHNFLSQFSGGKSTESGEFKFFYISSLKPLNLVLIPGEKLDGHRGTWTACIYETRKYSYSPYFYKVICIPFFQNNKALNKEPFTSADARENDVNDLDIIHVNDSCNTCK